MYDVTYGPGSGATTSLTVSFDNSGFERSAASDVLSGVISSNGSVLSGALNSFSDTPTPLFSTA